MSNNNLNILSSDKISRKPDKITGFRFIDLFAGIGGMRLPFDELGGRCVFSSEINRFAQQTYSANFDEKPHGDITQILPEEIPAHDLILGGFPCQPFSQAGLKKGFEDTRGTLFFNIAGIIEHHQPAVVLLENVKGFKTHDRGRTCRTVIHTLSSLGYSVFSQVLNAKDFGVPQNRERIFIIALKGNVTQFNFPDSTRLPESVRNTCVGDILGNRVDDKYTLSDKLWAGHLRRKEEHRAKGYGFGYSLFDRNSAYTSTLSARYYKDGSEILIGQPGKNPRRITPREAARLQGFPENFIIPVSDTQAYKQFGNSVAVPVIRALSRRLTVFITDHDRISAA